MEQDEDSARIYENETAAPKHADVPKTKIEDDEEYDIELKCLQEKVKFLENSVDSLLRENAELKEKRDEVEAIKLQIALSERIREDMKFCKALEVENQEIKKLMHDLYDREENRSMIKFRNKEFDKKFQANPSLYYKVDEIDMYTTYKRLVNYNDNMRSENIFLKIELGRLRNVLNCRTSIKSDNTVLKHEISCIKDKISATLDLPSDTRSKRSFKTISGSSLAVASARSTPNASISSSFHKTQISNPFRSQKNTPVNSNFSIQSNTPSETPSIKELMVRLEQILNEEKEITTHIKDKVAKCSARPESRFNSPEIYCKYFLKKRSN